MSLGIPARRLTVLCKACEKILTQREDREDRAKHQGRRKVSLVEARHEIMGDGSQTFIDPVTSQEGWSPSSKFAGNCSFRLP